jgi:hypothetical protein
MSFNCYDAVNQYDARRNQRPGRPMILFFDRSSSASLLGDSRSKDRTYSRLDGIIRFMNRSNNGTVNAVSPCSGL